MQSYKKMTYLTDFSDKSDTKSAKDAKFGASVRGQYSAEGPVKAPQARTIGLSHNLSYGNITPRYG